MRQHGGMMTPQAQARARCFVRRLFAAALLAAFLGAAPANAAGNDVLDTSFGSGGIVVTDATERHDQAVGVGLQSDGRIVLAGCPYALTHWRSPTCRHGDGLLLTRYTASGVLDPTFGNSGVVDNDFGSYDFVIGMDIAPDDKIVVAGEVETCSIICRQGILVARYLPNGQPDPSFGSFVSPGRVITSPEEFDRATMSVGALSVQPDGKVLVAGQVTTDPPFPASQLDEDRTSYDAFVVRYTATGALDETFGTGGFVPVDFEGGYSDHASSLLIASNSNILVGGASDDDFAIARLQGDGSLDPSFSDDGVVVTRRAATKDGVSDLAAQSVGGTEMIVAAGSSNTMSGGNPVLLRYFPSGVLDAGFGTNGIIDAESVPMYIATGLAIDESSGAIVVSIRCWCPFASTDVEHLRYVADGRLDRRFGNGSGRVITDLGGKVEFALDVVIQPDRKVLVAGGVVDETGTGADPWNAKLALVRYSK